MWKTALTTSRAATARTGRLLWPGRRRLGSATTAAASPSSSSFTSTFSPLSYDGDRHQSLLRGGGWHARCATTVRCTSSSSNNNSSDGGDGSKPSTGADADTPNHSELVAVSDADGTVADKDDRTTTDAHQDSVQDFLRDYFAEVAPTADQAPLLYGRLINAARLVAEHLYQRNGASVGAMAEGGGDEGAADRWLRGILVLLRPHLPAWWDNGNNNDESDNVAEDQPHTQALWKLAHNRRQPFFIRKCVDPRALQEEMGDEEFVALDLVSLTIGMAMVGKEGDDDDDDETNETGQTENTDETNSSNDQTETFMFDPQDVKEAHAIWGPETLEEMTRLSAEERMNQAQQNQTLVEPTGEQGHWWGPATEDSPMEAYRRLIDAARRGALQAYEERGDFVGAVCDATEEMNGGKYDHLVVDDDGPANRGDDMAASEETGSGNTPKDAQGPAEQPAEQQEENEEEEEEYSYNPTSPGRHAQEHLDRLIQVLHHAGLMPPWWDENPAHTAAVQRIAADVNGPHFLGHPLDKEEVQETYGDNGSRHVSSLANVASAEDLFDDGVFDRVRKMLEEAPWEDGAPPPGAGNDNDGQMPPLPPNWEDDEAFTSYMNQEYFNKDGMAGGGDNKDDYDEPEYTEKDVPSASDTNKDN